MILAYYHIAVNDSIELDEDYKNECLRKLDECIDELPTRCKKVFVTNKILGKNQEQVTRLLNISRKTIEGHITNAYKLLKVCMDDVFSR